jgi:hypothetical protein
VVPTQGDSTPHLGLPSEYIPGGVIINFSCIAHLVIQPSIQTKHRIDEYDDNDEDNNNKTRSVQIFMTVMK